MKRSWKILLWIIGSIFIFLILILFLISPVTRWVVEANSESWTGRKIEVRRTGINLLTGSADIRDLKIFEKDSDSIFLSLERFKVNVHLWKLMFGQYHIQEVLVDNPSIHLIQQGDSLNFSDLIHKFGSEQTKPKESSKEAETIDFKISNVQLSGGIIQYHNPDFQSNIEIKDLHVSLPELTPDDPKMMIHYGLTLGSGGIIEGSFELDQQSSDYVQHLQAKGLNIGFILPYLKPYLRIKELGAMGWIDLSMYGNLKDSYGSAMSGSMEFRDFVMKGSEGKKGGAFSRLFVVLDSMNTRNHKHGFVSLAKIELEDPYIMEQRFDSTDSFQKLIQRHFNGYTTDGEPPDREFSRASKANPIILLADLINKIQKVVVIDSFDIQRVMISHGGFDFVDHTLLKPANLHISDLRLQVDSLNSGNCNASGTFHTKIETTGEINIEFSLCPYPPYNFDATYQLKNIKVIHYNQYAIYYTDYPFKEGTVFYNGSASMKNKQLKIDNNLFIKKIYLGEKVDNEVGMHLPMKLILAIVRDKEGNVFLELPIEGDLNNPKVKYWDLIWQAVKNFFRKIFTSPARQMAKEYGVDEQIFQEICFNPDQIELNEKQKHQLDKLAEVLTQKPQLLLDFEHLDPKYTLDSISPDTTSNRISRFNKMIREYISSHLTRPETRIRFSSRTEPMRKETKNRSCYKLVYSVGQ
jgi:hypothetical protein